MQYSFTVSYMVISVVTWRRAAEPVLSPGIVSATLVESGTIVFVTNNLAQHLCQRNVDFLFVNLVHFSQTFLLNSHLLGYFLALAVKLVSCEVIIS